MAMTIDAFHQLNNFEDPEQASRMIARASLDPYYSLVLPQLTGERAEDTARNLFEAGFFNDGATAAELNSADYFRLNWLCTPLHKLATNLQDLSLAQDICPSSSDRRLFVLLSTGAFCPVHHGHIEMMEIAARALKAAGKIVIAGYLSPSHDSYVMPKCREEALRACHRLHLVQEAVKGSPWLMECSWEALATDRMVNFTDVISRLKQYLLRNIPRSLLPDFVDPDDWLEVAYVFGSDNARFSLAFSQSGSAVCVARPGCEEAFWRYRQSPLLSASIEREEILFVEESSRNISSQMLRCSDSAEQIQGTTASFWLWKDRLIGDKSFSISKIDEPSPKRAIIYLRQELEWATGAWQKTHQGVREAGERFLTDLQELFACVHRFAKKPDEERLVQVDLLALKEQLEAVKTLARGQKVISLDPCIPGTIDLKISRAFPLSDGGAAPFLVARPGAEAIDLQLDKIPGGDYILFDDDIFSGATVLQVQELLPLPVKIRAVCALTIRARQSGASILDILDSRDFLAGSREGGLVLSLPDGSYCRSPYCLPYTSPSHRASVPIGEELQFSRRLWQLNADFHKEITPPILLREASPAFFSLMQKVGFAPETEMRELCLWHEQMLGTAN